MSGLTKVQQSCAKYTVAPSSIQRLSFPRKRSLGTAAAAEIAATRITSRGKDRNVLVTICSRSISDDISSLMGVHSGRIISGLVSPRYFQNPFLPSHQFLLIKFPS